MNRQEKLATFWSTCVNRVLLDCFFFVLFVSFVVCVLVLDVA